MNTNDICNAHLAEVKDNGPADIKARMEALDIRESYLVKAPAGSGKTELLTQRFLALLTKVNKPEEILAITFTNKAGAEMRSRIVGALLSAQNDPQPEALHSKLTWQLASKALERSVELGWSILEDSNRLKITTIDAFYGSIARSINLSGAIGGNTNISDDFDDIYSQAAQSLLSEVNGEDEATVAHLERVLLHVDNSFERAERMMVSLLGQRDNWLPLVLNSRGTDLRSNMESVLTSINSEISEYAKGVLSAYSGEILDLVRFAATNLTDGSLSSLAELSSLYEIEDKSQWSALTNFLLTGSGTIRKTSGAAQGFPAPSSEKDKERKAHFKAMKDQFKELVDALSLDADALSALLTIQSTPPTTYSDYEWEVLESLLSMLPLLAAKLLMVFKKTNAVDHVEVATSALMALGTDDNPTDLMLVMDNKISHLLVDEFQDTSLTQIRGLELLTAGWTKEDGRTLFLVGDAQQSIYSFRGSNVGLFLDVTENGIGTVSIKTVELTVNFRSQAGIVNWVNNAFSTVFPKTVNINLGGVPCSEALAIKPELKDLKAVRAVAFAGEKETSRKEEGKWLAKEIDAIRSKDEGASIAVLVRSRSHLESTLASLTDLNIPYQAIDIEPLKDRLVVRDLSSLVRAIVDFNDRIAWLSLLRSPLCGLTLSELEVVANDKKLVWSAINSDEVKQKLSETSLERLNNLISVIGQTTRLKERRTLAEIIFGAWIGMSGPATVTSKADTENAKDFFGVLKQFSLTTFDEAKFENVLDRLFAKPSSASIGSVQIMTMHKSKGLQFDYVFIPGCERLGRSDDTKLLAWDRYMSKSGESLNLLSASPKTGTKTNPLFEFIKKQGNERDDLETDRILYVGCTRGVKQVILSACLDTDDNGEHKAPSSKSFMGKLWAVVSEDIEVFDAVADTQNEEAPVAGGYVVSNPVRLNAMADISTLERGSLLAKYRGQAFFSESESGDIGWQVGLKKIIGVFFHSVLRQVVLDGVENWDSAKINSMKEGWRHRFQFMGVPEDYLIPSMNLVTGWLTESLKNDKMRWILDGTHSESECELELIDRELNLHIIDRCFISNGVRWVIDYKTTTPNEGEDVSAFESRMVDEHQEQLKRYAGLFLSNNEEVRCMIVVPATQSYIEVAA